MMKKIISALVFTLISAAIILRFTYFSNVARLESYKISKSQLRSETKFQKQILNSNFSSEENLRALVNSLKEVLVLKRDFPKEADRILKSNFECVSNDQLEAAKKIFGKSNFRELVAEPFKASEFLRSHFTPSENDSRTAELAAQKCLTSRECWSSDSFIPQGYWTIPQRIKVENIQDLLHLKEDDGDDTGSLVRLGNFCTGPSQSEVFHSPEVDIQKLAEQLKPFQPYPKPINFGKSWILIRQIPAAKKASMHYEIIKFPKDNYSRWFARESQKFKEEYY